jgi:hypothetical protein
MATDPIGDIVSALSSADLVTPSPATINSPAQPPSTWEGATAAPGSLLTVISTLMNLVYGASSDMQTVGNDLSDALTKVAGVVKTLADGLGSISQTETEVSNALSALQQALALAQTLAPGSATTVLTSGSQLFTQLQNLLAAPGMTIGQAAAEMAQLSQQLTTLSTSLKPQ